MSRDALCGIVTRKQFLLTECDRIRNHRSSLQKQLEAARQKEEQIESELRQLNEAHFAELHKLLDAHAGPPQQKQLPAHLDLGGPREFALNSQLGNLLNNAWPTSSNTFGDIKLEATPAPAAPSIQWEGTSLGTGHASGAALSFTDVLRQNQRKRAAAEDSSVSSPGPSASAKKAKHEKGTKISLAELQQYCANVGQYWSRDTKLFDCPVCKSQLKCNSPTNACLHLVDHLGDKAFFLYKCPLEGCEYAAVRQSVVQSHVKNVHKMEWSEELKRDSVHTANKTLVYSFFGQVKAGNDGQETNSALN
ncbi:hypothetical protein AAVH_04677 [Aphelenchoides avenae]|nr:hypothetical protein AAVH_04677 [Aphelenchus avenae]